MTQPNTLNGAVVTFINICSSTVLDLDNFGRKDGTPIFGYSTNGGKNQQWKLIQVDTQNNWPIWRIQSVATGTFVDLLYGGTSDGTAISGWSGITTDKTNTHQLWRLVTADPSGQCVKIQNVGSNTYIDLYDGSAQDGTKCTGSHGDLLDGNSHQIWEVKRV